jgi:hypothetical protein
MVFMRETTLLPVARLRPAHVLMGVNRMQSMTLHRATLGEDPYGRPPAEVPGVNICDKVHSIGDKGKSKPIAYEIGGDFITSSNALMRVSQKNMTSLAIETLSTLGLFLTRDGLFLIDKRHPEEPLLSVADALKKVKKSQAINGPLMYKQFSADSTVNIRASIRLNDEAFENDTFLSDVAAVTFNSLDLHDPTIIRRYVQVEYHVF